MSFSANLKRPVRIIKLKIRTEWTYWLGDIHDHTYLPSPYHCSMRCWTRGRNRILCWPFFASAPPLPLTVFARP